MNLNTLTKPKILHLLNDRNLGGIRVTLDSLNNSRLNEKFDFAIASYSDVQSVLAAAPSHLVLIHNPSAWKYLPSLLKLKKYGVKLLICEHHYSEDFETLNVPSKWRFRLMLKVFYRLVDQVVAISQSQTYWMQKYHLVAPHQLVSIQQGRILDAFLVVAPQPIQKPLRLAAYGRFSAQKGFDCLLQAMRSVPADAVELRIGGYGPDEMSLKQLAQGLENIQFCGQIQDVPAFLAECDAVVIPSRWEPWGHVCQEAKAAGKPVIASDVDGLSEQVQNCGVLVPPDNPQKLAEAIQMLAALPTETLAAWGQAGRESVRNAWEKYLNEWEHLFKTTLSS
jgi:glycosyltransferase involved in cell wall biosynthesis